MTAAYRVLFYCEVEADDEVAAIEAAEFKVSDVAYEGSLALPPTSSFPILTVSLVKLMRGGE